MPLLRRSTGGVIALVVMALSPAASAQEAPPPIDVPTAPVPQGPPPTTPTPGAPKPPPPASPPPKTTKKEEPSKEPSKESKSDSEPTKYNNEGVFKVSGAKGPGYVGKGAKTTGAKTAGPTNVGKKVAKVSNVIVAEWPGFRNTVDGGSEVMVEFSKPIVAPTEHKAAGTITYVFVGAHVIKSNNQNPLLTMHFNTPVLSARLVPKKGELHLVIDLRPGVDAPPGSGIRVGAEAGGQQFFVKFPAGSYLPKDDLDDEPIKKGVKKTPSTTKTPPSTKKPNGKGPAE
jgi:hypothetical protein